MLSSDFRPLWGMGVGRGSQAGMGMGVQFPAFFPGKGRSRPILGRATHSSPGLLPHPFELILLRISRVSRLQIAF